MTIKLLENHTTNAVSGWVTPPKGEHALSTGGVIGTATLKLRFRDGAGNVQPESADFTFTAFPAPFTFFLPEGWSLRTEVSGVGGGTSINLNLTQGKK